MKNFNYKIEKQYCIDVYNISFYECYQTKLNDKKLDIPRLLNLSKDEYEKFLSNYNFFYGIVMKDGINMKVLSSSTKPLRNALTLQKPVI